MSRTVRDVLDKWLVPPQVEHVLRELADVLSTGDQWVTREVPADQLAAGDVIVDRRGRLWAVTAVGSATGDRATVRMVRGDREHEPAFDRDQAVPTLLTRTDARALAVLERELGAEVVGREVG